MLAIWWWLAFAPQPSKPIDVSPQVTPSPLANIPLLSPLDRELLHRALAGDFQLMARLIMDWEVDAQLLIDQGKSVKRLSREELLRSQSLSRQLKQADTSQRFLPQTYVAASILLALVGPQQIVALPKGLRLQKQLYPPELTNAIPLDTDRYNAEKLYLAQPDIAFVSGRYSHPSTLQALKNQGIKIAAIESLVGSLQDIKKTIAFIGENAGRSEHAELLNLFIDAAFAAIDNRYQAKNPDVLYLSYFEQFYLPSPDTIACELLTRQGVSLPMKLSYAPLEREILQILDPKIVLISTSENAAIPSLHHLKAVQEGRLYFLDDDVQQTPTQYVVLAYFDLVDALARAQL